MGPCAGGFVLQFGACLRRYVTRWEFSLKSGAPGVVSPSLGQMASPICCLASHALAAPAPAFLPIAPSACPASCSGPTPCSASSLREDEGGAALLAEHRPGVVPLLIRLLYPKMRKRSGRLGGKGEPGRRRGAEVHSRGTKPSTAHGRHLAAAHALRRPPPAQHRPLLPRRPCLCPPCRRPWLRPRCHP